MAEAWRLHLTRPQFTLPVQHNPASQAGERERVAETKRGELHALRGQVSCLNFSSLGNGLVSSG